MLIASEGLFFSGRGIRGFFWRLARGGVLGIFLPGGVEMEDLAGSPKKAARAAVFGIWEGCGDGGRCAPLGGVAGEGTYFAVSAVAGVFGVSVAGAG